MLGPDQITFFYSKGPTEDNCIKPDILAPSEVLMSAGPLPNVFGSIRIYSWA